MKEFTFIVITYNHEKYVVEHLESVKNLIQKHGTGIEIDLIVADDKSSDATIEIVNNWLLANRQWFRDISIIEREENIGTIRNIKSAIDATKTEQFKFLAGDDKYNGANIFKLYKKNTMIITPVKPFGNPQKRDVEVFRIFYRLILKNSNRKKLANLLSYASVIPAAGVFMDSDFYRLESLWEFLGQFRLIEDYPTWSYLLNKKEIDMCVEVLTTPYIYYQMSSGISTGNRSESFLEEERKLFKTLKVKTIRFPKYINVFRYIYVLKRFCALKMNSLEAKKIDEVYK